MTTPQVHGNTSAPERHAWIIGGVLLLASAVIGAASQAAAPLLDVGVLGAVLYAAALAVFAFGLRGAGSVTARRPLGTAALVVLAAWLLAAQIARAAVVPRPWRWAPGWVLAVTASVWLLEQVVSVGVSGEVPPAAVLLMAVEGLVSISAPVFLGVVAVVLATRSRRTQTVPVFRTSD